MSDALRFGIARPEGVCLDCWPKAKLRYMASAREEYVLVPKCSHVKDGARRRPRKIQLSDVFSVLVERVAGGFEFRMRRR